MDSLVAATRSAPETVRNLVFPLLTDRAALGENCPCRSVNGSVIEPEPFVEWATTHHPSFEDHHPLSKDQAHRLEKVSRIWWNADEESQAADLRGVEVWRNETHQQSIEWSWTAPPYARRVIVKDEAASADETKSCWVILSPTDLDRLREAVLTAICDDAIPDGGNTSAEEHSLRRSLRHYIETGSFPYGPESPSAETSHTKVLRRRAFETIRDVPIQFADGQGGTDVVGSIQSRGAGTGAGGGNELTDRPEFAEEVVFASVCAELQSWIQNTDEDEWCPQLGQHLKEITDESSPRPWHNPSRC